MRSYDAAFMQGRRFGSSRGSRLFWFGWKLLKGASKLWVKALNCWHQRC